MSQLPRLLCFSSEPECYHKHDCEQDNNTNDNTSILWRGKKGTILSWCQSALGSRAEVKEKLMVSRANINNTKTISFTLYTYGKRVE